MWIFSTMKSTQWQIYFSDKGPATSKEWSKLMTVGGHYESFTQEK